MRTTLDVLFPNNMMPPFVLVAISVPKRSVGVASGIQASMTLPRRIERFPRRDSFVDVSGKDESV